jgi:mRNA-degrading endonuclease RelE of RelBE toxin-antitoxin system
MKWTITYKDEQHAMKEVATWPPLYRNAFCQLLELFKTFGGRRIPNVKIEPLKGDFKGLTKAYLKRKYRIIYSINDDYKEICIHNLGTRQGIYK